VLFATVDDVPPPLAVAPLEGGFCYPADAMLGDCAPSLSRPTGGEAQWRPPLWGSPCGLRVAFPESYWLLHLLPRLGQLPRRESWCD